jgi:diguanylate cyclase (GGDEF)-like protein
VRPDKAWPQGKESRSSELNSECEEELQHQLERASHSRGLLTLLLLEIEQFKLVKNPHGSEAGNALLSEFFLALMKKLPASAGVARFGEEQFAVMFPGIDATSGLRIAKQLKRELENTGFSVGNPPHGVQLTIGVGVAVYPHDSISAVGLLAAAGAALAEAKHGQDGRVALYYGVKTDKSLAAAGETAASTSAKSEISPPSFLPTHATLRGSELDLISASLDVAPLTTTPGRLEGPLSVVEATLQHAPDYTATSTANAGDGRRRAMPADDALQLLDHMEHEIGYGGPAARAKTREANASEQRGKRPRAPEMARARDELQLICSSLNSAAEAGNNRSKAQTPLPPGLQNEGFQPFSDSPGRSSRPGGQAGLAPAGVERGRTAVPAVETQPPQPARPEASSSASVAAAKPVFAEDRSTVVSVPTVGQDEPSNEQGATGRERRQSAPPKLEWPSHLRAFLQSEGAPDAGQKPEPLAAQGGSKADGSSPQAAKQSPAAMGESAPHSGTRREQRLRATFPVKISGMDTEGKMFEDDAATIDVTTTGARLSDVRRNLQRGCIIELKHRTHKARYVVKWIGEKGTPEEGQAGLQLIDQGKLIWGRALPRVLGDQNTVGRREKPSKE